MTFKAGTSLGQYLRAEFTLEKKFILLVRFPSPTKSKVPPFSRKEYCSNNSLIFQYSCSTHTQRWRPWQRSDSPLLLAQIDLTSSTSQSAIACNGPNCLQLCPQYVTQVVVGVVGWSYKLNLEATDPSLKEQQFCYLFHCLQIMQN